MDGKFIFLVPKCSFDIRGKRRDNIEGFIFNKDLKLQFGPPARLARRTTRGWCLRDWHHRFPWCGLGPNCYLSFRGCHGQKIGPASNTRHSLSRRLTQIEIHLRLIDHWQKTGRDSLQARLRPLIESSMGRAGGDIGRVLGDLQGRHSLELPSALTS